MNSGAPAKPLIDGEWLLLLRSTLAHGEHFRWPLQGTSMRPTLPPGCLIEIAPLPNLPRLGDIVVFFAGGALVAHRLVQRHGDTWITQGDGRPGADRPQAATLALGVVIGAFRTDGRRFWPGRFSHAQAGWWIARYHLLKNLRRIRNLLKEKLL